VLRWAPDLKKKDQNQDDHSQRKHCPPTVVNLVLQAYEAQSFLVSAQDAHKAAQEHINAHHEVVPLPPPCHMSRGKYLEAAVVALLAESGLCGSPVASSFVQSLGETAAGLVSFSCLMKHSPHRRHEETLQRLLS